MLDSGWAAALAAIVTALIVAGTAVAAFRQLRHGRNANDIVVYLRLDYMDSPQGLAARQSARAIAEKVANDAAYRAGLIDPASPAEDFRTIGEMLRFLEHISVLITKGGVAENLVLAEYADTFADIWELLRPAIQLRRLAIGPFVGRAFEHLAMRAKQHIDSGAWEREYAALERDARTTTA